MPAAASAPPPLMLSAAAAATAADAMRDTSAPEPPPPAGVCAEPGRAAAADCLSTLYPPTDPRRRTGTTGPDCVSIE
eukprot:CAMPEP_0198685228 /NCGR_PEP_ID=MMETSP1468-20131203/13374_1 /TAXON_ID=1461545 /ORGANISM="Mantoniella sp, Strain CCMP1436" /LENGTH=76 /DNA_ID=CAMNT_0044430583 /DNA_START=289 /DNA_END=519 /DNA_ORIENTATION=+